MLSVYEASKTKRDVGTGAQIILTIENENQVIKGFPLKCKEAHQLTLNCPFDQWYTGCRS